MKDAMKRHRHRKAPPNVTFPELETCYANRIGAAWRKAVESIIEAGRILIEAKEALPGRFIGFVEERLGMSPRTAERLMAIAADTWITDSTHVSHLPPSWGTIYLISTLAVPNRERLLEVGCIRPDMQRADIEKAIRQLRGSGSTSRKTPAQPIIEAWAQARPSVERLEAAMARNAEAEAEALATEEIEATERCCSFCDEANVDLVCNPARSTFVCLPCAVEAAALLAPTPSPEIEALRDAMLAHLPPEEQQSPKRERPSARQHGDEPGGDRHYEKARATGSGGNGSA
jgi:hypothetical protein